LKEEEGSVEEKVMGKRMLVSRRQVWIGVLRPK
jgi:hypothetical protein